MDENTIVVTDELGNEVEYEILFTFENEENGLQCNGIHDPEQRSHSTGQCRYPRCRIHGFLLRN